MNIQLLQTSVEQVVIQAGELLLSYFNTALERHAKSDGSFATNADLASEKLLIEKLGELLPEAGFYAEESGISNPSDYMWVIDPLDGTTNFAQGIAYFCVSVALTYKDERILGVVYQPCTKQLWAATKGNGATLNGEPIQVAQKSELAQAVIGCAVSYEIDQTLYNTIELLRSKVYSIRIMGAAALDIVHCASGQFDGVLFKGLKWWDVAAGSLIVEEAGAQGSTFEGNSINKPTGFFIGGSELIFKELSSLIIP